MTGSEEPVAEFPDVKLYIDGQWKSRDGQDIINPADEGVLGRVPHATRADLDDAIAAAERGFKIWSRTAPAKRAEIMLKAAQILTERTEEIAASITMEQGKILAHARLEVVRACDIIRWDAEECRRLYGRVIPAEPGMRHSVLRLPVGVVAAFSPWNYPVASPVRKVAGALAAGCSLILKGSEETPAGAMHLVRAFADAGLPAGVLNLVFGVPAEVSEYLIPHPTIRLVTFTGSVPVGKHLAAMAGQHMKPSIMELGGHGPVIVCADADASKAGTLSAIGKSVNSGQVCVSPTRFFVEEAIYDTYKTAFAEKAAAIKVGNGLDASVQMGPVTNDRRVAAAERLVADAVSKGAKVLAGGSRQGNNGYFFPLTVLADVPDDALAMREEPFGPLALLSPVKNVDEAIEKANSVSYGLAGYAFTNSARTVEKLSQDVEVGNLSINHFVASIAETPFGGVKDSGFGREGGVEGLENYTVVKNVSHLTA